MAARQRGDDGLHMIYIKEGNVRPFMKPLEEGREEGGSVVASRCHRQGGQHFSDMELKCYDWATSHAETLTAKQQVCVGKEETASLKRRPTDSLSLLSGTDVQIGYDTKLNWFRTKSKHHQQVIHYFGGISQS